MPSVFKALSDPIFRQDVKRGVMDALNRGMVAGGLGAPVDLATMALRPFGYNVEKPVGGSEWIGDKMRHAGMVSDQRNALAEAAAGMLAPTGYADPIRTGSAIAGLVAGGGANGGANQAMNIVFKKSNNWADDVKILEDGTVEIPIHTAAVQPIHTYRDKAFDAALKKYKPKYEGFFRFTNNKDEIDIAESGALNNSMNHSEGFAEKGLSVADGPHYGIQGYKHGYRVDGDVVGRGSDDEPLIDPKKLRVLSKLMSSGDIVKADRAAQAKILKNAGLPKDYLTTFKFLNDPRTFDASSVADGDNALMDVLRRYQERSR